jgi:hypothetical protein
VTGESQTAPSLRKSSARLSHLVRFNAKVIAAETSRILAADKVVIKPPSRPFDTV